MSKNNIFDRADDFSLVPLLSLLPHCGDVARLTGLTSSLFARYEKVSGLLKETAGQNDPDLSRRSLHEQEMLRQILDWLEVRPEQA